MSTPETVRGFFTECRRLAEQTRDIATQYAAMRKAADAKGIDWSQLKSLAIADVADEEKGDGKKVKKLVERAEFASAYADMLGLRSDARANPGHDEDEQERESCSYRSAANARAAGSTRPQPIEPADATPPGQLGGEAASPVLPQDAASLSSAALLNTRATTEPNETQSPSPSSPDGEHAASDPAPKPSTDRSVEPAPNPSGAGSTILVDDPYNRIPNFLSRNAAATADLTPAVSL